MGSATERARGGARRARRLGTAALILLAMGWASIMQSQGWAQTSYMAFVKALSDGTAQIDRYHWETRDKSWTNGHFFSVKAPGLPFLLLPEWKLLQAVGADRAADWAAANARRSGHDQWGYRALVVANYGYSRSRALAVTSALQRQAPLTWALGLFGSLLPALGLLFLVRGLAERLRPGLGTATALSLGMATLVMVFATQLFSHVLSALILFGAFALLWKERRGPPRTWLVAGAGLLAGLAVDFEYPLALGTAILGVYAITRRAGPGAVPVLRRALAYGAGALAGVVPLLAYNLWAFGSVTTTSYANAVDFQGLTGHDTLGLNSGGFFGVGVPDPRAALELLLAPRGIIALTPVVAVGLFGAWLLYRRGLRAEALTIGAIAAAYFLYDTGYWLPFGGGTPGPRFLIPVLPFVAVGIAEAWRRLPATTLVTSACGASVMTVAAVTYPLVGSGGTYQWWERISSGIFQNTVPTALGAGNGWAAIIPTLLLFLAAAALGALATRPLPYRRDLGIAAGALAAWVLVGLVVAPAIGERNTIGTPLVRAGTTTHSGLPWQVVAIGAGVALVALAAALASRGGGSGAEVVDDDLPDPAPGHAGADRPLLGA